MKSLSPVLKKIHTPIFSFLFLLFSVSSCSPLISVYDQYAYTQTTSLKVDAMNIMGKATEDYSRNEQQVLEVLTKLDKVYEYEKNRGKNEITTKMWEVIKNPDKNLLGGFIKRWKAEGRLGSAFVDQARLQVAKGFDLIAELEGAKIKRSEGEKNITSFIGNN